MGVKFSDCYQRPPSPLREDHTHTENKTNYKRYLKLILVSKI